MQDPINLDDLQAEIHEWMQETFGSLTPQTQCRKLHEEVGEVHADPEDITELADVLILLLDIAARAGHSATALIQAAAEKHELNKTRTFTRGIDGLWRHMRDRERFS